MLKWLPRQIQVNEHCILSLDYLERSSEVRVLWFVDILPSLRSHHWKMLLTVERWPIASQLASYIILGWLHYCQLAGSIESLGESG